MPVAPLSPAVTSALGKQVPSGVGSGLPPPQEPSCWISTETPSPLCHFCKGGASGPLSACMQPQLQPAGTKAGLALAGPQLSSQPTADHKGGGGSDRWAALRRSLGGENRNAAVEGNPQLRRHPADFLGQGQVPALLPALRFLL
uniref:Uncharacterized protein n=1 Tax=Sphaerodactylus townsendi TaxID=933632 RepID=A0ACB8F891_9SAUR